MANGAPARAIRFAPAGTASATGFVHKRADWGDRAPCVTPAGPGPETGHGRVSTASADSTPSAGYAPNSSEWLWRQDVSHLPGHPPWPTGSLCSLWNAGTPAAHGRVLPRHGLRAVLRSLQRDRRRPKATAAQRTPAWTTGGPQQRGDRCRDRRRGSSWCCSLALLRARRRVRRTARVGRERVRSPSPSTRPAGPSPAAGVPASTSAVRALLLFQHALRVGRRGGREQRKTAAGTTHASDGASDSVGS